MTEQERQEFIAGLSFDDQIDPADKRFRVVKFRVPADPSQPNYGPFEYHGEEASIRLRLMAAALCVGYGYISDELGELIKDEIEDAIKSLRRSKS